MAAAGPDLLFLVSELADRSRRGDSAARLAQHLGARDLMVFICDAELDVLLPAPGFPQTVPAGPGWDGLLTGRRDVGHHQEHLEDVGTGAVVKALAIVIEDRSVFVFLGGDPVVPQAWLPGLSTLSVLFRAENTVVGAAGRAQAAQEAARHATTLMTVLESVRAEAVAARTEAVEARTEAVDANRAKDEFLAMLGHELRNPLSPIVTALQIIKLRGEGPWLREHDIIERQVEHMLRLVDDLLDVSRITRGKLELKAETLELSEVVDKAVEMALPLLERRRHRLTCTVPNEGMRLRGDSARLAQVIANLLTNAARYTEPGGDVSITASRVGEEIAVTVKDNGTGIAKDMLARIFDPFVQAKTVAERTEGGLGIGLALVKNIVQLHGGSVMARSPGPNQGAEFEIHLPAGLQDELSAPLTRARTGTTGRVATSRRVLIVDDNKDAAEMLGEILRMSGHSTAIANDGPQALLLAPTFRPEIAILDIGLPVMDGYELAAKICAQQSSDPRPRLIALTGYGGAEDRKRSREGGFDAHLVKPISASALLAAIEGII